MSMTFSHSSVKKFRRCKRQYMYSVIEGLESRMPKEVLKRGTWFHKLMAAYYQGQDWEKLHRAELKKFNGLFIEEREMYGDLPNQVERMMRSYLHHYRKDEWEVLHVEETFKAEFMGGDIFSFQPDLVVLDHSYKKPSLWVVDHKTVKSMPSSDWRMEDLQSTLYPWAMREMGYEVEGFIFNYIRAKSPTVPHINQDGSISRARIDTDFLTMARFLMEYYKVDTVNALPKNWKVQLKGLQDRNTFFKRTKIIKDKALVERQVEEFSYTAQEMEIWHQMHEEQSVNVWTRTLLPSCEWDCDFRDLCAVELMGGDGQFMRRSKYQPSEYTKGRKLGRGK